jgi:MFS transporter, CP family, cyanate transporter
MPAAPEALLPSGRSDGVAALLVIAAGVVAALHVGKLPPAIPVLRDELGLSLLQGGFLLSVMQMAGMTLGILAGLLADRMGLRRTMLAGLCLLTLGSAGGAAASQVPLLLAARMVEGAGLLLTVLPAPGLLRRLVREPQALSRALGAWGAYMPTGAALAMLLGPMLYQSIGWRWSWVGLAALSLAWAWVVWRRVPADPPARLAAQAGGLGARLRQTLTASGPWLVALAFFSYSGQWLAVVGFLPTIQTQAGWSVAMVGIASASAAGANGIGNVAAGRLLAHGWQAGRLLLGAYLVMAGTSALAFSGWVGPGWQLLLVMVFSAVGGLIPGTLFGLAVRLAPNPLTVSTTVGWVQQLSSFGQFAGPPLVAWLVAWRGGDWAPAWWFTAACCLSGLVLSSLLHRRIARASD